MSDLPFATLYELDGRLAVRICFNGASGTAYLHEGALEMERPELIAEVCSAISATVQILGIQKDVTK